MHSVAHVAYGLARELLAGPWRAKSLWERGGAALGRRPRWLRPLAKRLGRAYAHDSPPSLTRLAAVLRAHAPLRRSWEHGELSLARHDLADDYAPDLWLVPRLETPGALAEWLGLAPRELDWFADRRWLTTSTSSERLRHYRSQWLKKRSGGWRLLEAPKPRLKALQRRVLHEIVDLIPCHSAAHGFVRGRSIRSYVAPHAGRQIVVKCDLRDFFPSITFGRVVGMFLTAGYGEPVAVLLASLCCHVASDETIAACAGSRRELSAARALYRRPHLPQGAPTSPALANLCAYRLDLRLTALADSAGADYSRYADDLLFSGDDQFARGARRFVPYVLAVALDEGFALRERKTRLMRRGVSQRAAGLVLNETPNVPRQEFDQLKATLHNAAKLGPASQNRAGLADFRMHLSGRVAWVEQINPRRGAKLRRLFDRICW